MRIAMAQVWQETHTFNPMATGLVELEESGLYFGDEILEKMWGVAEIGGFLAAAEEEEAEVELVPIIRAWAGSGGRVTGEALDFLEGKLVSGLRESLPVDGVLLSLHGAAAADRVDDFEGYLLSAVRRVVGESVPVVVSLDHHANITQRIVESVNALVGYQTQPHDPFETGERAARTLFAIVQGVITPTVGWQKIPMVAPADRGLTAEWPMREWFDLARAMEEHPGVISVSNFPVQPWLDVAELGWATVVVTDNDQVLANQLAAELANKAWELREAFWAVRRVPPEDAIRQAVAAKEGPIVISDASDSVLSGAPGDGTCLLKEMLRQRITCTALLPMIDPQVVEAAIQAGPGSQIAVLVGGKLDPVFGEPVEVTGTVAGVAETGLTSTLTWGAAEMGRTVLLDVGSIRMMVSELRGVGGADPDAYRHFGVEPAEAQMAVVKMYFNFAGFRPIMKGTIMADCPGLSGWDLRQFKWERAPRPVFPLDELPEWQATV